jgi:predicted small secreted protein
MHRRVRFLSLVLLALSLVLAGCGTAQRVVEEAVQEAVSESAEQAASSSEPTSSKGGKGTEATPEATAAPAEEQEPAEEPSPEEAEIDPDEVTAFDTLDSYRMTQAMRWQAETDEGTEEGEMRWEIAYVREPAAMHWIMSGSEGPGADDETYMEMIQVEGTSYVNYDGDEWMAITSDEDLGDVWSHSPDDLVDSDSQRVGTETVNGYRCVHYRSTDTAAYFGMGQLTEADYWVSTEHDVVVRGVVGWLVDDVDGESGEWHMEWNITDINEPITIVAPEGVAKPGLPEDVPLMPGASNVSSMMGMTNFEVEATADEVTTFYMEALEDNGWTHGDSPIPSMHSFSKDGRELTLMIDDESTPTEVTIMIAEG